MNEHRMEIIIDLGNAEDCNIPILRIEHNVKKYIEEKLGRNIAGWLNCVELLYLLDKMGLEAYDRFRGRVDFANALIIFSRKNPYVWVEYEVYLDLRKRGRRLLSGPRRHTFLVRTGKKQQSYKYYLLVLETRRSIPIIALKSFIEEAVKNRWEPVIAIVDSYGDITYYSVGAMTPWMLRGSSLEGQDKT